MTDETLSVFDHIESQTSAGDRRSLLALRELAAADGPFAYLEIGSHLGGSLQPFVIDDRCTSIVSIDPRPQSQPDNRLPEGRHYHYDGNSTERMLELLGGIPGANVGKITAIEEASEAIDPASIAVEPTLCFIDGEHTDRAALADALFCAAVAPRSIVAFHDRSVVGRGIAAFMQAAGGYGHPLPDSIFVVDLAHRRRLDAFQRHPRLWQAMNAARLAARGASVTPLRQTATAQRLKAAVRSR
jgi:hypothetical protein